MYPVRWNDSEMESRMDSGGAVAAWNPKPQQNAKALRLFCEGMDDMHGALTIWHVGPPPEQSPR